MLIDNFIILKEKIDTDIGNFYLGKFHPNTNLSKLYNNYDIIVLMKPDSVTEMIGYWIKYNVGWKCISNIWFDKEDKTENNYRIMIEFIAKTYNYTLASFSIHNKEAINAAESLGFKIEVNHSQKTNCLYPIVIMHNYKE